MITYTYVQSNGNGVIIFSANCAVDAAKEMETLVKDTSEWRYDSQEDENDGTTS